jgi:acyl transferase domain-containing protein/NAD(P)H-dependent flavin oxidoreductase YrpB (nitropropane dioxygenase family)/NAD(P)-dependent dehydrogenase (short-subunit alcohol dehydrogenase family)/phosphopantetheinyl transferase
MLAFPPSVVGTDAFAVTMTNGVLPLVDLHDGTVDEVLAVFAAAKSPVYLRLFHPQEPVLSLVLKHPEKVAGIYLEAPVYPQAFALGMEQSRIPFGAIVTCRDDFPHVPAAAALPTIARGNEAGGYGGPLSTFVLLQLAVREFPRPFFLEGGLDVQGAKAATVSGCHGVVLSGAAWGFPELGAPFSAFSRRLSLNHATRRFHSDGTCFWSAGKPHADRTGKHEPVSPDGSRRNQPATLPADHVAAGPDIAFADGNFQRFQTLATFIGHLNSLLSDQTVRPVRNPLAHSRLGRELGGSLPIIQGPMARVTENANFLAAVHQSGAVPVAALSSISPEAAESILSSCGKLGFCPGLGIIGLALQSDLVEKQLQACRRFPAPFVLVAAPRPELVEKLRNDGHRLLVHLPHPALLNEYLDIGVHTFILEGSESGGHIGPLSSMVLWQSVLARLSQSDFPTTPQVIFAGGMVSPTATRFLEHLVDAYLPQTELTWGIQVGTAYLATRESVQLGAISMNYRNKILNADRTLISGESVGLRARQAATPFVKSIIAAEEAAVAAGISFEERRRLFEERNLGNLGKAVVSQEGDDGCFMAGEGVTMIDGIKSMVDLHTELLSSGKSRQVEISEPPPARPAEPIAIIGMGCTFPGSDSPGAYFGNIMAKRCFIGKLPEDRLESAIFHNPDPLAPVATYSRIAGYLRRVDFDSTAFRVPPRAAAAMDLSQKLSLMSAKQALSDAGYLDPTRDFDRDNCGVIVGNSMGGMAAGETLKAVYLNELRHRLGRIAEGYGCNGLIQRIIDEMTQTHPVVDITEDTLPGELGSLIAGRIASTFDLHGPNFTIDGACGSSLAAIIAAINALRLGQINLALAGGSDAQMDPGTFIRFAKVSALSGTGSFPLDSRADGFVMGEGCGLVLLKRYSDAIRDGDKIYALILGVGQSSDGKGKGITAPNPEGQMRAIQRAWANAGKAFSDIGYLETHGTGTKVGDVIELNAVATLLRTGNPRAAKVPVGSVKANIGHLKAAAGIAGLIKTAWAVHQRIIPPQTNFRRFPETVDDAPIEVPVDAKAFSGPTFLAGVSSFGFGGTNHHLVIGETPANKILREFHIPEISGPIEDQAEAKVAAVFPGQGSQYVGMLATWRNEPEFRDTLAEADRIFQARQPGFGSLTELVFPTPNPDQSARDQELDERKLQNTLIAQPAILSVCVGLLNVAKARGLTFDMALGHSLGEYAALYSGGLLSFETLLEAVCQRARYMTSFSGTDFGAMAVLGLPAAEVAPMLETASGYVVAANLNSPKQTVISGETGTIERIVETCQHKGILARKLNVSAAFHSKMVAEAAEQYRQKLGQMEFSPLRVRVPSNLSGEWYPDGEETGWREKAIDMLVRQIMSPVDFIDQIERAYAAGVRTFVEIGPKNVLSKLIKEILGERPHACLNLDHPKQDSRTLLETALQYVSGTAPSPTPVSRTKPHPVAPATPQFTPAAATLEDTVLAVIEEISGYPKTMIKPDLDLEADLGIDTLKIFEIAGRLRSLFPSAVKGRIDLTHLRTMQGILTVFAGAKTALSENGKTPAASTSAVSGSADAGKEASSLKRHVLQVVSGKLDISAYQAIPGDPTSFLTLKTTGHPSWDEACVKEFSARGFRTRLWTPSPEDLDMLEAGNLPDSLKETGFYVHAIPVESFSRKTRKSFYRDQIFSLFLICRLLGKRLNRLLILLDLGSDLRKTFCHPSGAGFLAGVAPAFCQALEKDFPNLEALCLSLDSFGSSGKAEENEVAHVVLHALLRNLHGIIGLHAGGEVFCQKTVPIALPERDNGFPALRRFLTKDSVILATGGGSGITAAILAAIAAEFKPEIIILGRSPERNELVTELRNHGSKVWYLSCDLADGPAVDKTAELVRRAHPHIDLLIHGAGIELSKSLPHKTPEEIDRVYRVKVAGLVNLLDALGEENVGVVVGFSSVASLFGNPGQVDYAAANGFLNQFAGKGKARFLTIAWTAWADIGMASRGAVHEILRTNHVEFIDPPVGKTFLLRELNDFLATGTEKLRTAALFGRLGPALGSEFSLPHWQSTEIGRLEVNPVEKPWLKDHSIDGKLIVPAVISLSGLIDELVRGRPTYPAWITFSDLQFFVPIKTSFKESVAMAIKEASGKLELWAIQGEEPTKARPRHHLSCRTGFTPPTPEEVNRWRDHIVKIKLDLDENVLPLRLESEESDKPTLERVLFHGPAFQVLKAIQQWNQHVLLGIPDTWENDPGHTALAGEHIWPFYLEAALHGAGIYSLIRVSSRKFTFPSTVERIDIDVAGLKKPGPKVVYTEFLARTIDRSSVMPLIYCRYHVYIADAQGNPLLRLGNLRMVAGQDEPREKLSIFTIGTPIEICDRNFMAVKFADADKVLADIQLRRHFLTAPEEETLKALEAPKRRKEWLAGRMALKILVSTWFQRSKRINLALTDFSVSTSGEIPRLHPEKTLADDAAALLETVHCSISHGEELGAAVLFSEPIGLDIEQMRPLAPNDIAAFLTPEELTAVPPGEEVALWTAKEAISKVLGLGFRVQDFHTILLKDFGFGEPYSALYTPTGQKFTVVTIKDRKRTASMANFSS